MLKKCVLGCLFIQSIGQRNEGPSKPGIPYAQVKDRIKPLDLILFKGNDAISSTVMQMEKFVLGNGDWSHCGLVLSTDIVPIRNGVPGRLYIWESVFDTIKDVELDDYVFGVQVRDLEEVVSAYNRPLDTKVAWCRLRNSVDLNDETIRAKTALLYKMYNHVQYNYSLCDLLNTLTPHTGPFCQPCFHCSSRGIQAGPTVGSDGPSNARRKSKRQTQPLLRLPNHKLKHIRDLDQSSLTVDEHMRLNTKLFCSELIALVYVQLGLLPPSVDPKKIAPVEFLGINDAIPCIVEPPVLIR